MLWTTLRRVAVALMFIAVASPALAADVSGVYHGTYTATQVPGELKIVLTFRQDGTMLSGTYSTSTGVSGVGSGVLSNNTAKMAWKNTTPKCPGTYNGIYTFVGQTVTWTYSGKDCAGPEKGKGQAKRVLEW